MAVSGSSGGNSDRSEPTVPLHLCFFLLVLLMFLSLSWYSACESALDGVFDHLKLLLLASPLLLLLAVHCLSAARLPPLLPLPEKDSLHRAGATPWGVGFLLVLLLFMISYQSYFQERWFPLLSR